MPADTRADVTVIVPTYNRAGLLRESVESLLEQSMPPREILVVDDGSSDDTASVVATFGERVRYLRQANGGKASALNLGLQQAGGESVWIFDDDDTADPDALKRLSESLDEDRDAGFAFGDYDYFHVDESGYRVITPAAAPRFDPGDLLAGLFERCFIFQPALLVRRRCYADVGPFDTDFARAQDYDMLLRLAHRFRGVHVPHILFHQRVHVGRRGTALEPIDGRSVWTRQREFDAKVLVKFREHHALADFLPPAERSLPLDGRRELRALLRRAAATARRMLWEPAADDLAAAVELGRGLGVTTVPATEAALLRRVFDEFGYAADVLDGENPMLIRLAALAPDRLALALMRALTWPLFRYVVGNAVRANVGGLARSWRRYRAFADLGTVRTHISSAIGKRVRPAWAGHTMPERSPPIPRLTVGCWPGPSFEWNGFPAIFSQALEDAGCDTVDIDDPAGAFPPIDVLHIHWPDKLFWGKPSAPRVAVRIFRTLRALRRLRRDEIPIVWMVHNLRPHEISMAKALLWRWLATRVATLASGYMTLCPATVPLVAAAFPALRDKPFRAAWHPAYPVNTRPDSRLLGRQRWGVAEDQHLFAFLGLIRPYKGLDALVRQFRASAPRNARLLIAGGCEDPDLAKELSSLVAEDSRIVFHPARLDETEFEDALQAADTILLPYRDYLHSGSMIHALAHAKPVITPSAPFSDALAALVGERWVRTYRSDLPPESFLQPPPIEAAPDLSALDPHHMAEAAVLLYRKLLAPRSGSFAKPDGKLPDAAAIPDRSRISDTHLEER